MKKAYTLVLVTLAKDKAEAKKQIKEVLERKDLSNYIVETELEANTIEELTLKIQMGLFGGEGVSIN